ncbi:MAG: hypothetical protein ACRBB5_08265 [Nitrosopumilus sp.]
MRFDSCRKGGTELKVNKKCDVCREVSQFFCQSCSHVTDEQIHAVCRITSLDQSLLRTTIA